MHHFFDTFRGFVRQSPATWIFVFLLIIGAVIHATNPSWSGSYGIPTITKLNLSSFITAPFIEHSLWIYLISIPAIAGIGTLLEKSMGTKRYLILLTALYFGSIVIISGLLLLLGALSIGWALDLSRVPASGVLLIAYGLAGTGTAFLNERTRYILRAALLLLLVSLMLYSARLIYFYDFAALSLGLILGPWAAKRSIHPFQTRKVSERARIIAALTLLYIAVTTIVTAVDHGNGGIFNYGIASTEESPTPYVTIAFVSYIFLFSAGILKQRRNAWRIVLSSSIIVYIISLLNGLWGDNIFNLIATFMLIFILINWSATFSIRSNKQFVRKHLLILLGIWFGFIIIHTLLLLMLATEKMTVIKAFLLSSLQLVGLPIVSMIDISMFGEILLNCITVCWIIYVFIVVAAIIASRRNDDRNIRQLLRDYLLALMKSGRQVVAQSLKPFKQ